MPKSEMIEDFTTPRAAPGEASVHDIGVGAGHAQQFVLIDPVGMLSPPNFLGTRKQIETELDIIALAMRAFHRKQPDQIMKECAAYGARLTELAVLLHRVESTDRQYTRIRTQQVERYLTEVERQFKIASRLVEVLRQDLHLSGAQV